MHVILNGGPLEEVDCFQYLGSQVAADGGCERDVVHTINERYRAFGAQKSFLSNRGLGINKCLYEAVIVPTALYRALALGLRSAERRIVNVLGMKCLGNFVGVSRMYRVRKEEVRRRAGIEMGVSVRSGSERIEMVWAYGRNGRVQCGQKGVDGGSKRRLGSR